MMSLYWRAVRGRFLGISLVSILLGAVSALREQALSLSPVFPLVIAGGLLVHAGANLWNDFADELNGADRANPTWGPANGGSRVIQRGELSAGAVGAAAIACFGLALAIAVCLVPRAGFGVPVLTLLGITLAYGYSSRPLWLCARGLGELCVAACFGPLLCEGTVLALSGGLSWLAFWASVPIGLLVGAILLVNGLPDEDGDRAVGKRTLGVRWGARRALAVYRRAVVAAFILLGMAILAGVLPLGGGLAFGAAPLAVWVYRRTREWRGGIGDGFATVAAGTGVLHLAVGLLLVFGLWL